MEKKVGKIYHLGDFIITSNDNGALKIRSDKGVISIRPHSDSSITIKSVTENEIHGK